MDMQKEDWATALHDISATFRGRHLDSVGLDTQGSLIDIADMYTQRGNIRICIHWRNRDMTWLVSESWLKTGAIKVIKVSDLMLYHHHSMKHPHDVTTTLLWK